jgi:hypothetical protein
VQLLQLRVVAVCIPSVGSHIDDQGHRPLRSAAVSAVLPVYPREVVVRGSGGGDHELRKVEGFAINVCWSKAMGVN